MFYIVLMLVLGCENLLMAQSTPVVVSGRKVHSDLTVFSESGRVQLPIVEARVELPSTKERANKRDLLVLFDENTKHTLWLELPAIHDYNGTSRLSSSFRATPWWAISSFANGITWWRMVGSRTVEVFSSSQIASDQEDAFSMALRQLGSRWQNGTVNYPNETRIKLTGEGIELDDFTGGPGSAAPQAPPRIESITRVDEGYRLRLRGNWLAEGLIGDDMALKSPFRRVGAK